jgi:hypothetical protein
LDHKETPAMADLDLDKIGANVLAGVRDQMGALWDELSASDRALIEACAIDAGTLAVASAAASSPAERDAVRREQAQISAQLANLKAVADRQGPPAGRGLLAGGRQHAGRARWGWP